MYLQIIKTVHVRWPARPAELRAGLEFSLLLSLFQDKESKDVSANQRDEHLHLIRSVKKCDFKV